MGGNQSTERKFMHTQGEHANPDPFFSRNQTWDLFFAFTHVLGTGGQPYSNHGTLGAVRSLVPHSKEQTGNLLINHVCMKI